VVVGVEVEVVGAIEGAAGKVEAAGAYSAAALQTTSRGIAPKDTGPRTEASDVLGSGWRVKHMCFDTPCHTKLRTL
jgi:hypothetical protein